MNNVDINGNNQMCKTYEMVECQIEEKYIEMLKDL